MLLTDYLQNHEPKVICVDFDDTLVTWFGCLHDGEVFEWDKEHLMTEDWYQRHTDRYAFNPYIRSFLDTYKNRCQALYVVSWRETNISLPSLERVIEDYYDYNYFRKILITGTREGKVSLLKSIALSHEIAFDELLLIDDHPHTTHEAKEAGFAATTPQAIMHYVRHYVERTPR